MTSKIIVFDVRRRIKTPYYQISSGREIRTYWIWTKLLSDQNYILVDVATGPPAAEVVVCSNVRIERNGFESLHTNIDPRTRFSIRALFTGEEVAIVKIWLTEEEEK